MSFRINTQTTSNPLDLNEQITLINKQLARSVLAANASGNDRNLDEHGENRCYWYSIGDGLRLTADIRTEKLGYKETHSTKSKEEVVSATRENEQRVFLSDPYYVASFKEGFIDDIKTITGRHARDVHGVDQSGKNQRWKHMPVLILIPLLSSQHWRVIRVEVNYKDKNIHILWDDPYGKDQFPKALIEYLIPILKEGLEVLIQEECHLISFNLSLESIYQYEKTVDQQGKDNSYDCGPIVFDNIRQHYVNPEVKNEEFIAESRTLFQIPLCYQWNHEEIVLSTRRKDINRYRKIAGTASSVAQKCLVSCLDQRKPISTFQVEQIQQIHLMISKLPPVHISKIFEVIFFKRLQHGEEFETSFSVRELEEAYRVVVKDEDLVVEKMKTLKISSSKDYVISIEDLRKKILVFLEKIRVIKQLPYVELERLQMQLNEIRFYLSHPDYLLKGNIVGGLRKFRLKYEAKLIEGAMLLRSFLVRSELPVDSNTFKLQSKLIFKELTRLVQLYKIRRAYTEILKGKKFTLAGFPNYNAKHPLRQINPIQRASTENINRLKQRLKDSGGTRAFGLRDEERNLFASLLNLPYKMQHATDQYYPILSSGSLDSYTEIQRENPSYESQFSTKGNIQKLGNGGFVFFRVYVESINNEKTRYGHTTVVSDLHLLRKCGWISLHDQLNPFPYKSPGSRRFYWGKRLLRTSEAVSFQSKPSSDKGLYEGLSYHYRLDPIDSYSKGRKDPQKDFSDLRSIQTFTRGAYFTEEIFYGKDILLGIALSVIYELRCLHSCGFRQEVLERFSSLNQQEQIGFLGELIKGFFRIEGKYPVALPLEYSQRNYEMIRFEPYGQTDHFPCVQDRMLQVKNPDGKGHYNSDMSENEEAMKIFACERQLSYLEGKLSNLNRQIGRLNREQDKQERFQIEQERNVAQLIIDQHQRTRLELIEILAQYGVTAQQISEKVSTYKLLFINDHFLDLLEDELVGFFQLTETSLDKLRLIKEEPFIELIVDGFIDFQELCDLSLDQLEAFLQSDIKKPIEEGFSLKEIVALYEEDPIHLRCLTEDILDLINELSPDVNPIVMEYAQEEVDPEDLNALIVNMGDVERSIFEANSYIEPPEDEIDYEALWEAEWRKEKGSLSFGFNDWTDSVMEEIVEQLVNPYFLSREKKPRALNLRGNKITDEGIKCLARVVGKISIEALDFGFNNIGYEGVQTLAKALMTSKSSIIEIDLSGNNIGENGEAVLKELQRHCPHIKVIYEKEI